MSNRLLLFALALVAACSQESPEANASEPAKVAEQSVDQCPPPALVLADGSPLQSTLLEATKANFGAAYQRFCGLLPGKAVFDAEASDGARLFLINAPEANVASIYRSEVDGNRMVLEYHFLTPDGKTHVPSEDELFEAIYCKVEGATPEEQESTGRCLPD